MGRLILNVVFTEFYDVHANFFRLHVDRLGEVYFIGPVVSDSMDRTTIIKRSGNFYSYKKEYGNLCDLTGDMVLGFIRKNFRQTIRENGYKLRGKYTLYTEDDKINHKNEDLFQLYKGFRYRIFSIYNEYYLCVDPSCVVLSTASIEYLAKKGINLEFLEGFSVRYIHEKGYRISGYLMETEKKNGEYISTIKLYRKPEYLDIPDIVKIEAGSIFPESRPEILESFLNRLGSTSSLIRLIRNLSFLDSSTASRDRFIETLKIIEKIESEIFPIEFGGFHISLSKEPIIIKM